MSRALDTSIAISPLHSAELSFPRVRALRVEQEGAPINLVDYLSLSGCELQRTIARSNDALGKVAQASTRLLLHLEFLRLAPDCIAHLREKNEAALVAELQAASRTKREQLPAVIWAAIVGGAEYRAFWQQPNTLADYPSQAYTAADAALVSLTAKVRRWLAGQYELDRGALEADLRKLASGDGGALLKSLAIQQQTLTAIDRAVQHRSVAQPLCTHGSNAHGEILSSVVQKFFVADVQAWSARVEARRYKLLPKVRELEAALAAAQPAPFADWQQHRDSALAHYAEAPKRHAQTLMPLLQQCGRAPTAPE